MTQATKTTRTTRASGTRKKTWTPPSKLETPKAPDGVHYRWVRHELLGDDHAGNVHERSRQGYEPVRPEELGGDWQADVLDTGKHAGIVRSGDLILMKVDQEIADQRNEYFANKTKAAEGAVNSELQKNNSAVAPISQDEQSSVSVGGGRNAKFED
jgi:hypothetical protein